MACEGILYWSMYPQFERFSICGLLLSNKIVLSDTTIANWDRKELATCFMSSLKILQARWPE